MKRTIKADVKHLRRFQGCPYTETYLKRISISSLKFLRVDGPVQSPLVATLGPFVSTEINGARVNQQRFPPVSLSLALT